MTHKLRTILTPGDYVLATKYDDGDPCDHFFVGFFVGMLADRYLVADGKGNLARASGFRRCERISNRVGHSLCMIMPVIGDTRGRSIWWWRRHVSAMETLALSLNITAQLQPTKATTPPMTIPPSPTSIPTTTLLSLLSSHARSTVTSHRHAASQRNYDLCRLLDGKLDLIQELRTQLKQGWEEVPNPTTTNPTKAPTTP